MRRGALALVVLAAFAAPGVARADRAYDVLAPGQHGGLARTAHSTDQIALYDGLTPLFNRVSARQVNRLYKPNVFGTRGQVQKAAHDRPHGVTPSTSTEVKHQPGVAGKTGRHGFA